MYIKSKKERGVKRKGQEKRVDKMDLQDYYGWRL